MTLAVSVTSSASPGQLCVQWSDAYFSRSGSVAIVDVVDGGGGDNGSEWIAVISGSAMTIQLQDAADLDQQSRGSVIIQTCSCVIPQEGFTAYRMERQSQARRLTSPTSTTRSAVATSHSAAGLDYCRRFIATILRRLVPEFIVSFFTSFCEYLLLLLSKMFFTSPRIN